MPARVASPADPDCRAGSTSSRTPIRATLRQIGDFVELPSGHTSTCIQNCKYIWTGGPARGTDQGWLGHDHSADGPTTLQRLIGDGRPIWVTDLRDPENPRVSYEPIDLWRNDGYTDYSHDVDEDARGIAWMAGRGGIRGYATRAATATRTRTASARRRRSTRSSWPAAANGIRLPQQATTA